MTNNDLLVRQKRLQVRSAQLRLALADQAQVLRRPLALTDRVQSGFQWLCHNPLWPLGALVLVILVRPPRTVVWSKRLWWTWKVFNHARHWLIQHPLAKQLP